MANRFTDFFKRNREPENQVVGAFTLSPDGTTLINYKPDKPADIVAVPDGVEKISSGVFAGQRAHDAKTILLPDSVIEIGDSAFAGNKTTESVVLPANLEVIGRGAFADSPQLKVSTIPDSIQVIDEGAFRHNQQITDIDLSNSNIQRIGDGAFLGCKELKEVNLPSTVEEKDNQSLIARDAFKNSGLEHINIPEGTTKIEPGTFTECRNLKDIEIPDGVQKIGMNAFYNSGLNDVMLPSSVDGLGDYAFGQQSGRDKTTIYIPEDASESLKNRAPGYSVIVPENNTVSELANIGLAKIDENGTLINVDKRVSGNIVIDEKISHVDDNAFAECKKISSISIESNFTNVSENAFGNITNVEWPKIAIDEEMMQKAELRREQEMQQLRETIIEVKPDIQIEIDRAAKIDNVVDAPIMEEPKRAMSFEEALADAKAREAVYEASSTENIVDDARIKAETSNIQAETKPIVEPVRESVGEEASAANVQAINNAMSQFDELRANMHDTISRNFDHFRETFPDHVELLNKIEANNHATIDGQPPKYPEVIGVNVEAELLGYAQQPSFQQNRVENLDKVVDRYQEMDKQVVQQDAAKEVEKEQEAAVAMAS